jgi:hypothetical protein
MSLVTESPSPQRRFLRDLALLLGLPGIIMAVILAWWQPWRTLAEPFEVSGSGDVFAVVSGTWDWEGADGFCRKNPHTVSFSPDRTLMTFISREPYTDSEGTEHLVTEYDIQEHTRGRLRGLIRGETRMTAEGVPVVWDLVLVDSNAYRWHRTDWTWGNSTKSIRRCPADAGSP